MEADILRSGRVHSGTMVGRELPFYYYRGKLVRGQGTRIYSRVVSSLIHLDTEFMKIFLKH